MNKIPRFNYYSKKYPRNYHQFQKINNMENNINKIINEQNIQSQKINNMERNVIHINKDQIPFEKIKTNYINFWKTFDQITDKIIIGLSLVGIFIGSFTFGVFAYEYYH